MLIGEAGFSNADNLKMANKSVRATDKKIILNALCSRVFLSKATLLLVSAEAGQ